MGAYNYLQEEGKKQMEVRARFTFPLILNNLV
jgi:hypothetical protein